MRFKWVPKVTESIINTLKNQMKNLNCKTYCWSSQGDCGLYVVDKWSMLVLIFLFFYVVGYHSRLVEVTSRLDFLWKQQAAKELTDISETRTYNTQLLKNILPDHVASYFLATETSERRTDVSIICRYWDIGAVNNTLVWTPQRNCILKLKMVSESCLQGTR